MTTVNEDALQVGDPAPPDPVQQCREWDGRPGRGWFCTREPGHSGQHLTADAKAVLAVWPA
jgi:hypothetical protein